MKRTHLLKAVIAALALAGSAAAQDFDGDGLIDALDPCPGEMVVSAPARMVAGKTLTLRVDELDGAGNIDWRKFEDSGTISAERVADGSPVPISITVFDTHDGVPPPGSVRFYNGVGSVSVTLDNGAAEPAGDVRFTVTVGGVSASRVVTVLQNPPERVLSGTLAGADLTWSASDGVVHIVGNCTVPVGQTLTIGPGTLVMVDAGPANAGTRISVSGRMLIGGTDEAPVFFFPTSGPPALHLNADCDTEPVYNVYAWRGFFHNGSQLSTYNHVFITGAGNAPRLGHARPPVIEYTAQAKFEMNHSVVVDNNGKFFYGNSTGTYTIRNCLISRDGMGAEFTGTGAYTMLIEDCWFTGIGHAPPSCTRDGDGLGIRQGGTGTGSKIMRRCYIADGNDDGIDHRGATFTLEDCIIWNTRDKGISLESQSGGGVTLTRCLIAETGGPGLRSGGNDVFISNSTVLGEPPSVSLDQEPVLIPDCSVSVIENSIIWSGAYGCHPGDLDGCASDPCCGTVIYNILGVDSANCGATNIETDPLFIDPSQHDYGLLPGSPALTAGPGGTRIGWNPGPPAPPPVCAPGNDACSSPLSISDGLTPVGTSGATTDGPSAACLGGDGLAQEDVWFSYESAVSGELTVSICDANFDTRLVIYGTDDCGSLAGSVLGCSDDSCGSGSALTVAVTNGLTYLIRLGGAAPGQSGSGTLSVQAISTSTLFLMSFTTSTAVPGVGTVQNEDIVGYNPTTGVWSMILDGSDIGLSPQTIDAIGVLPDDSILLSFTTDAAVAGVVGGPNATLVDDADLVRFVPTSLGPNTAGSLAFYFDGSDVGLDEANGSEDVDAIAVDPSDPSGNTLLFSTLGTNNVLGSSALDEDAVRFVASSHGAATAGTWSMRFDGSDVGLSQSDDEDVDGLSALPDGHLLLSTIGPFSVTSLSGTDDDIFDFTPVTLGANTAGSYSLVLSPASAGIADTESVNAIEQTDNPFFGANYSTAAMPAPCPADRNGDGLADDADLLDFLVTLSGDGTNTPDDEGPVPNLDEFLEAWLQGCP